MEGRYRLLTLLHHLYFAPGSREWWAHVTREFGVTGAGLLSRSIVTQGSEGLLSHLQRVLNVHRRLSTVEDLVTGLTDVIDRLSHGVVLVGVSGLVVHANRSAEELLSANDGLLLHERELRAEKAADTASLKGLIAGAMSSTNRDKGDGGLVVVARKSGRWPLRVLVTPLAQRPIPYSEDTPAALVVITDPEKTPVPSGEHLQRLFAMTPAETRVAMALVEGESVDGLADSLGITRNTARTSRSGSTEDRNPRKAAIAATSSSAIQPERRLRMRQLVRLGDAPRGLARHTTSSTQRVIGRGRMATHPHLWQPSA